MKQCMCLLTIAKNKLSVHISIRSTQEKNMIYKLAFIFNDRP